MKTVILPFFLPNLGCSERCCFCRQDLVAGGEPGVNPEQVAVALSRQPLRIEPIEIAFYGGSFTSLPVKLQGNLLNVATRYLAGIPRHGGVRVSTRPDRLDQATVDRLVEGGVTCVEIGCQSFSDQVLQASGRGHAAGEIIQAAHRVRRAGLRVGLQLMPGLPGGSRSEAHASLTAALRLRPDFVRIYPTVVLRGTGLAERFEAGEYLPLSLREAVDLCAEMRLRCEAASVPVIRVGIPLEGGLSASDVVAGPFHPAFGQLVKSAAWCQLLTPRLASSTRQLAVAPSDYSDLIGWRRQALAGLRRTAPSIELRSDPALPHGELLLDATPLQRRAEIVKRYSDHDRFH